MAKRRRKNPDFGTDPGFGTTIESPPGFLERQSLESEYVRLLPNRFIVERAEEACDTIVREPDQKPEWVGDISDDELFCRVHRLKKIEKVQRLNPSDMPHRAIESAASIFGDFNAYDPREVGEMDLEIPETMFLAGKCVDVTYRSDKWDDGTHNYIHKITSFPKVRVAVMEEIGREVRIPTKIRHTKAVAQIGIKALGYCFEDADGDVIEQSLPKGAEWFWSKPGRALICIKNKKSRRPQILAVVWGGDLDVKPRGIIG